VHNARIVQRLLGLKDLLFGSLEDAIEAAKHGEREDHVPVLPARAEDAEPIVGDGPDQRNDPAVGCGVHVRTLHAIEAGDQHITSSATTTTSSYLGFADPTSLAGGAR